MKERNVFLLIIIALVFIVLGFAATNLNLMPEQASTRALVVDRLFHVMLGIATFIFLVVEGALLYAVLRFRARPEDESDAAPIHGNPSLEIVWTLIPAIIVLVIGIYSFRVLTTIERPGANPMVVEVVGRQFSWEFRYPDQDFSAGELHLVVDRPVRFEITSEDVIHSFWIPAFRAKRDATPGRVAELLITPNRLGSYPVRCAELCGAGHATMTTTVWVEDQADFDAWVESVSSLPEDPTEAGLFVFEKFGCAACHTLSDAGATGTVGPNLDQVSQVAAQRVGDMGAEDYVRQSILEPNAHVVEGFDAGMMPADFGERMTTEELNAIVNYLLSK